MKIKQPGRFVLSIHFPLLDFFVLQLGAKISQLFNLGR